MPKQLNNVDGSVSFLEYSNLNPVEQNMSNSMIVDRGNFQLTGEF